MALSRSPMVTLVKGGTSWSLGVLAGCGPIELYAVLTRYPSGVTAPFCSTLPSGASLIRTTAGAFGHCGAAAPMRKKWFSSEPP